MNVFDRIRRIARANLRWLLDKAEPAEQELQEQIAELEDTIRQGRESAASYGATFKRLEREFASVEQERAELEKRAEAAVLAGNDEAARSALLRRVELGERAGQMRRGVEQGRRTFEMLRDNIINLQDQLRSAKMRLGELRARKRTAEAQRAFEERLGRAINADGEAAAFERLEDEVLETEAYVEASHELRSESMSEAELSRQSRQMQVEGELEALKERLERNDSQEQRHG